MSLRVAVLLLGLSVATQAVGAQEEAHASASGNVITITARNRQHRIALPRSVRVDMDTVEILDAQDVGAHKFLLLTVNGPTKRKGFGVGTCGAGFETGIVWLQLRDWRIITTQSQLVESCRDNSMITETIAWTGDKLQLTFLDIAAGSKSNVLRYDRNRPERGFTVLAASGK